MQWRRGTVRRGALSPSGRRQSVCRRTARCEGGGSDGVISGVMPAFGADDAKNGDEGVVLDELGDGELTSASSEVTSVSSVSPDVASVTSKPARRRLGREAMLHRGPSALWDEGQEWILIFDRLLNGPGRRSRECSCEPREVRREFGRAWLRWWWIWQGTHGVECCLTL